MTPLSLAAGIAFWVVASRTTAYLEHALACRRARLDTSGAEGKRPGTVLLGTRLPLTRLLPGRYP